MILALLLLLAPDEPVAAPSTPVELKLRFEKGMVYEEVSQRQIKLKTIEHGADAGPHVFRFDSGDDVSVRRTIVAVGEDGLPAEETVEVLKSTRVVNEAPDDKTGTTTRPSQGKTFTWKGGKLYEGARDVSEQHKDIVQRLKSRGAVRLPAGPVAPGAKWEVDARAFEESEGRDAPKGLVGKATFKLEEVKDGIARISFEIAFSYAQGSRTLKNTGQGTWLFDVKNGREVKLEAEAKLEIDEKEGGFGTQKTFREITYR